MPRRILAASALFLTGFATGALLSAPFAGAELSPPATSGMEPALGPPGTTYRYEMVSIKPLGRHPELFATLLEERGKAGWELCAVTQIADYAVFMREE
ncbi:MAG: hypothetical protein CME06_11075 [Gemmatimonadetes bacterium]|nr:hypothetical protein [Gemmatimonadota bacterium]